MNVAVAVAVGVGENVAVAVGVAIGVAVGVAVGVGVGVEVNVAVAVAVGVGVNVAVAVGVAIELPSGCSRCRCRNRCSHRRIHVGLNFRLAQCPVVDAHVVNDAAKIITTPPLRRPIFTLTAEFICDAGILPLNVPLSRTPLT